MLIDGYSSLHFDIPNYIMCHYCCYKLCRDRWGYNIFTPLKWIVKSFYFIIVIAIIKSYKVKDTFNPDKQDVLIPFDDLLIVYLLQHVIFIGMRPLFLCCFGCFALCYDQGEAYADDDKLEDIIISFDYIQYMTERRDLANRPDDYSTYNSNKDLKEIRATIINADYNFVNQLRLGLRDGLVDLTGFNTDKQDCMICLLKLRGNIVTLSCEHPFHNECFQKY